MNKADSNTSPKDVSNDEHTEFVKTNAQPPVMQPSFVNNMYGNTSQEEVSSDEDTVRSFHVEVSSQLPVMELCDINKTDGNTSQDDKGSVQ